MNNEIMTLNSVKQISTLMDEICYVIYSDDKDTCKVPIGGRTISIGTCYYYGEPIYRDFTNTVVEILQEFDMVLNFNNVYDTLHYQLSRMGRYKFHPSDYDRSGWSDDMRYGFHDISNIILPDMKKFGYSPTVRVRHTGVKGDGIAYDLHIISSDKVVLSVYGGSLDLHVEDHRNGNLYSVKPEGKTPLIIALAIFIRKIIEPELGVDTAKYYSVSPYVPVERPLYRGYRSEASYSWHECC